MMVSTQETLGPHRFPISIKGVILDGTKVVLLRNERDEWELPGGKLELGEAPEDCVSREIKEELGLNVVVDRILDTWVYHIREGVDVFIVTYGCRPKPFSQVTHSLEHKEARWFELSAIRGLTMPAGYKNSIIIWADMMGVHQ
jgi:8-oxo-dGTP pyrophosphatase MutT (NUDIX family)